METSRSRAPQFASTRWSVVLAAGHGSTPHAREALAALCQAYWYPLYAYVRRLGRSPEDAQDSTQAFFARLLEKQSLAGIRREGGRFRSFLLAALKHFLANEWDRAQAQKRGGGHSILSVDADAETRYVPELAHELTPERLFERQWAQTLLAQVLARLRAVYVAAGQTELFEHLSTSLSQPRGAVPYADLAVRLRMTEAAVKMAAQRLRARYRELLRAEIAQTVADPGEIEAEIRHLFATFAD